MWLIKGENFNLNFSSFASFSANDATTISLWTFSFKFIHSWLFLCVCKYSFSWAFFFAPISQQGVNYERDIFIIYLNIKASKLAKVFISSIFYFLKLTKNREREISSQGAQTRGERTNKIRQKMNCQQYCLTKTL